MIKVPQFQDTNITKFLNDLVKNIDDTNNGKMSLNTANKSLLLYSPSLKVFEIKVSDTGVITATKVSGT